MGGIPSDGNGYFWPPMRCDAPTAVSRVPCVDGMYARKGRLSAGNELTILEGI